MWHRLLILALLTLASPVWATSWPFTVPVGSGSAVVYSPQIDSFDGNVVRGRAVTGYLAQGATSPVLGVLWFAARVVTDRDDRNATLCGFNVSNIKFPPGSEAIAADVQSAVMAQAAANRPVLPLSALSTASNQTLQVSPAKELGTQPPAILFATEPAVLVTIDGEPKLARMDGTPFLKVINSPFTILLEPSSKTYYLRGGSTWYTAPAVAGPYSAAPAVPAAITAAFPTGSGSASPALKVIVATQPSELIVSDGPEQFATIAGTNLIYVSNSDDDVFVELGTQQIYVLLSGRWFTAKSQAGPWSYVNPASLPADFGMIPAYSPKAAVLASVPGTAQNAAALSDYQLPQTAALKATARIAAVSYDGLPEFQPMAGTTLEFAANTTYDILKVDGRYYCCNDAAWFASDTAIGPFIPTATVPEAVYSIPPTNPLYRVTFVRAYYSDPNMIWFGYLPGYLGSYVWNGTVVWGTGWAYPAWFGKQYIARPLTWGFGARYHISTGSWGVHIGVAGAQGWLDVSRTSVGHGWWGAGGYLEYGRDSKKVVRANVYSRDNTRLAIDPRRDALVNQMAGVSYTHKEAGYVADKDGSVYKRDLGGYQRFDANGWNRVDNADLTRDLDRQYPHVGDSFARPEFHEGRR